MSRHTLVMASGCYNLTMESQRYPVKTTSNANIAFTVVVLAAYFATFSQIKEITLPNLLLLVILGILYVSFGIYGFSFTSRSSYQIHRYLYLVIQMIIGGVIHWLGKGSGFSSLLLLPLAGQAVVLLKEVWAYFACLGIVLVYILSSGITTVDKFLITSDLPIFLAGLVFIVVFTQVAVGEERARAEVERLNRELTEANDQLREFASRVEELAILSERNRVAREIHDGLGHYLTTINMQIQAADAVLASDPRKAALLMEKAQALTQDALTDVRASVTALRLAPESELPISAIIEKLLINCESIGIHTSLRILGEQRPIRSVIRQTMFRVAQESINNICKHSRANKVQIILDFLEPDTLSMQVEDDGVGTNQMEGGFGLIGIRERVTLQQGEMRTVSKEGEGFLVEVRLPG